MKLFIANVTQQAYVLQFRLPENPKVLTQPIAAGQQVVVGGGDMTDGEVDAVIKQLSPYGLIGIKEIHNANRKFPWVYSIDKPVDIESIRLGIFRNRNLLTDQGVEFRKKAALATDAAMDREADEAGLPRMNQTAQAFDGSQPGLRMSVEEEKPGSLVRDEDDKPVRAGIRVSRDGPAAPKSPQRRRAA